MSETTPVAGIDLDEATASVLLIEQQLATIEPAAARHAGR